MEKDVRRMEQVENKSLGTHPDPKPLRSRRTSEEIALFDAKVHQLVTKTSPAIADELGATVFDVNNAIKRLRKRGVSIDRGHISQTERVKQADDLSRKAAVFVSEYLQEHKGVTYIDMLPELNNVIKNTRGGDITYDQLMVMLRRARTLDEDVPSRRNYRKDTESEEKIKRYEELLPLLQDQSISYKEIQEREGVSRSTIKRAAKYHRDKGLNIRGYGGNS